MNKETNRTYTAENGMVLKSKNARNSFMSRTGNIPEILHETRKSSYWLEFIDDDGNARGEQVGNYTAQQWLIKNKYIENRSVYSEL